MLKKSLIIVITVVLTIYIFQSLRLINRPIVENDEGIYWATFLLANKGYKLYKEISFSQLPGFYLAVYPIFRSLGSTILSTRLVILFWSVLALLSVFWLGYLKKNLLFSLIAISLAISIPVFFNQAITLQSDMIAVSFSIISFVLMIAYLDSRLRGNDRRGGVFFLVLSSIFFSFALLTKFDWSLAPPFAYLLLKQKKNRFKNILFFTISSLFIIILILNFFNIQSIVENVFILREKALAIYPFEPLKIIEYLKRELLLLFLIVINILLTLLNRKGKRDQLFISLLLWFFSSLILVNTFRPLFLHHLIFLVVPIVLLFSDISLRTLVTINRLIVTTIIAIIGIFLISFSYNVTGLINRQNSKSINDRIFAKKLILKYSNKNEFIVTDEAALYGMTGRLPPPELADLSLVQIQTQNISKEKFKQIILKYEPKMILAWNGRLNQMKGFEEALFDYKEINYSNGKKVFMLENFY